jgi:hypothetical protein
MTRLQALRWDRPPRRSRTWRLGGVGNRPVHRAVRLLRGRGAASRRSGQGARYRGRPGEDRAGRGLMVLWRLSGEDATCVRFNGYLGSHHPNLSYR